MTSQEMLQSDVLDILFLNRNKAYGAYALRRGYNRRLWLAVSTGIISISLLMLLIARTNKGSDYSFDKNDSGPVILSEVDLAPPPAPPAQLPPPKQPHAPLPPMAQEKLTSIINIVPDHLAATKDLIPPIIDLSSAAIGTQKTTGAFIEQDVSAVPQGTAAIPPPAPRPEVYGSDEVEEAALFPGGPEAFSRYLARQLGSPEELAPGETKTAKVQFVVAKDGTVLASAVLQSATAGLDALILKALRRSPKWKPARVYGEPVSVMFTLPVTFVGQED